MPGKRRAPAGSPPSAGVGASSRPSSSERVIGRQRCSSSSAPARTGPRTAAGPPGAPRPSTPSRSVGIGAIPAAARRGHSEASAASGSSSKSDWRTRHPARRSSRSRSNSRAISAGPGPTSPSHSTANRARPPARHDQVDPPAVDLHLGHDEVAAAGEVVEHPLLEQGAEGRMGAVRGDLGERRRHPGQRRGRARRGQHVAEVAVAQVLVVEVGRRHRVEQPDLVARSGGRDVEPPLVLQPGQRDWSVARRDDQRQEHDVTLVALEVGRSAHPQPATQVLGCRHPFGEPVRGSVWPARCPG